MVTTPQIDLVELRETANWLLDYRGPSPSVKLRHRAGLIWNVPGFSAQTVLALLDEIFSLEAQLYDAQENQ